MQQIGAFEAKNKFSNLLDQVERGVEIIITRRGYPVAKLVSVHEGFNKNKAQTAAHKIRARAKALKQGPFDWQEWKQYRDQGRP